MCNLWSVALLLTSTIVNVIDFESATAAESTVNPLAGQPSAPDT